MPQAVLFGCVSGFLGAGKTTAIVAAARLMQERGLRVGVVANDQGRDLVDGAAFRSAGLPAAAVEGGCFCCRFDDLLTQAERLLADHPLDVLLAEAVGSCADLVATVYRPLHRFFPDRFRLAPLTVLLEPERLREMESGLVPEDVVYLFGRQAAEADLLVMNKLDRVPAPQWAQARRTLAALHPTASFLGMSALTGQGVGEWVDRLLREGRPSPDTLDIDYDAYARGEAELAWLNGTFELRSEAGLVVRSAGEALLEELGAEARRRRLFLPHAKALLASSRGSARIALTRAEDRAAWSGDPDLPSETTLSGIVNARAATDPDILRALVEDSWATAGLRLGASIRTLGLDCFRPRRPVPRHRLPASPSEA
jgi:Ni2+-binding GTPase involved in maturation of urease and hydrogenase